jgi:uncharacterized membrane protein YbhN (UPF0104 family)
MKTKVRKTYNYIIRILIILATYGFIYNQVFRKRDLSSTFNSFQDIFSSSKAIGIVIVVGFLMLLNWGIESFKWRFLINKIERLSYGKAVIAVLTGIAVSSFTPNRVGDYFGRVFILEKGARIEGVLITILGSMSQLLVTFVMGTTCIFFMFTGYYEELLDYFGIPLHLYLYFLWGGGGFILLLNILVVLLFLNVSLLSSLAEKLKGKFLEKASGYIHIISAYTVMELLMVIGFSLLRFMIFSLQMYLLLLLFNVKLPFSHGMMIIAVVFFVMTIIPTIAITELGIRGSVSLFLIGMYYGGPELIPNAAALGIVAASTSLWLINLAFPALMGGIFAFSLKFFRKTADE